MPFRRRYRPRRRLLRKKRGLRRRLNFRPRRRLINSQYAVIKETIPMLAAQPNTTATTTFICAAAPTTQIYNMAPITLAQYARASSVAANYQFYKIKMVEVKFLPQIDTFAQGVPGTGSVPYLYYQVDKGSSLPETLSLQDLKQLGTKPIRLDNRTITIRWKPAVLVDTQFVATTGAQQYQMYKVSPWINTNNANASTNWAPSSVVHNGLKFIAEQQGTPVTYYNAEMTIHFVFKKPLVAPSPV